MAPMASQIGKRYDSYIPPSLYESQMLYTNTKSPSSSSSQADCSRTKAAWWRVYSSPRHHQFTSRSDGDYKLAHHSKHVIGNVKMNNSSATRYSEYLQLHKSYNKTTNVW